MLRGCLHASVAGGVDAFTGAVDDDDVPDFQTALPPSGADAVEEGSAEVEARSHARAPSYPQLVSNTSSYAIRENICNIYI